MTQWGSFKSLTPDVRHRLIWRSFGPEKVGKTYFGLTAPGPIAIQSFDIGLEGVVEPFVRAGKDIRAIEYEFDRHDKEHTQEAAQAIVDRFVKDYDTALGIARTIIWDTETELWELFRYAAFGANTQGVATTAPKDYVKLNSNYRDLIQRAYDGNVNLQLIQKVKERWKTDAQGKNPTPSGVWEPTGFKEAGYIVQTNLSHRWEKARGFVVKVENCRQNMALAAEEFDNVSFPELAQLVFPESGEGDWQ